MGSFAYYNGKFGKREEISIPLTDRALYFGDGVYDVAIGKDGKVFQAGEHVSRFLGNAKKLSIHHGYTHDTLYQLLCDVVKRSGAVDFLLYFQLSRSNEKRRHSYVGLDESNLLITIDDFALSPIDTPLRLITADDLRYYYCDIKTINLLPAVMASGEAERSGCDEAVLHRGMTVTECAHSNVSILKNGKLYTHPTNNLILPGITRAHLLMACRNLGIPYEERAFTLEELFAADEILISSTTKLCRRAGEVDGVKCGMKDEKNATALCKFLLNEYNSF